MKKMIISAKVLKPALKKLSQGINKNAALPVLSNLLCKVGTNEVEFITSDLELTIKYRCECETSGAPFEMLIPFDFISKVASLSGNTPISIELPVQKKAVIIGMNDRYELNSLDKVADYPVLPELPKTNLITLNGDFILWLNRAMATIGKDEIRPAMTKACMDIQDVGMTLVSTDAHVIFTHSFPVESAKADQLLVSPKIAKALDEFTETEIYWGEKHIAFKSGGITVIATRHEDKYPNYKAAIPDYQSNLLLDRQDLINALDRMCLNSSDSKQAHLLLRKEKGTIHFECRDENFNRYIRADIPGAYEGPVESVCVNASKLLTLMHQVAFDQVGLHIHYQNKAILITAESDPGYLGLIMPLIINE